MSVQPPGRRTESLFDNRYRYDYIFPRGRSGETLRAYDTNDHDRPVVIKRPAPQDAPPMRAGQEVNIRTERQALERLSGHPVLTELRGSGTFRVGGRTHEYIVMDLATGEIVENMVLERAERGETLPELETLVILDNLLDLLACAHDKNVIYNDVDAKHLFWDRGTYHLKVIDWGNAVFSDEPGSVATATRASDIYQCGELLYFILTGGNRLSVESPDGAETFYVNFGLAAEQIPARLQAIVTRAVHPDQKRRFGSIAELRAALADHRRPLEKSREDILARVRKRVRATASQDELAELRDSLGAALALDPGNPEANALIADIERYIKQINVQADLDAIRIYLESGNWQRALGLLHDLLPHADEAHVPLIRFLMDAAATLDERRISPPPTGFLAALDPLFEGNGPAAGQALLVTGEARTSAQQAQWVLAELLTVHLPDVTLLRPHIARLHQVLNNPRGAQAAAGALDDVVGQLKTAPLHGLTGLLVIYQQVADDLDRLIAALEAADRAKVTFDVDEALASTQRALRASDEIVARLREVGETAFSDPQRAGNLLRQAAAIDTTAPYFSALHDYFDEIHQAVEALGQFRPRSNGANLAAWFADVEAFLQPYLDDLPDPALHEAYAAVHEAAQGWIRVLNYTALGRRQPTIDALRRTADAIRPTNETVAAWLGTLANKLPDMPQVERMNPNEPLADKLIEGYAAWDRGDAIRAADLGRHAYKLATTDGERLAAERLRRLGELLDHWVANNGLRDVEEADRAEKEALALLLGEEERERETFAEQMPNTATYLRAMGRGIVAYMRQSSSAGWRTLFMHYILRGDIAMLQDDLEEAEFWRSVAEKTFDNARTHRAFQILDRALTARRLVDRAEHALNDVHQPSALEGLRQTLNAPLAGEVLAGANHSVQAASEGVRHWTDGEFFAARQAFDNALNNIQKTIEVAHLQIRPYVEWLTRLRDTAGDLQQVRLTIEQTANSKTDRVDPALEDAHQRIVEITVEALGPDHAHLVRQWLEMYQAVVETYTSQRLTRREKLAAFDRHFASLFINRHPAFPLFRQWEAVIEHLPPDVPEDDLVEVAGEPPDGGDHLTILDGDAEPVPVPDRAAREGGMPWNWIIALALVVLIAVGAYAVMRTLGRDDAGDSDPPGAAAVLPTGTAAAVQVAGRLSATPPAQPTRTLLPQPTLTPTLAPPSATATLRPPTATATLLPSDTPPPSLTPTPFVTATLIPTDTPAAVAAVPHPADSPRADVLKALAADPPEAPPDLAAELVSSDQGWIVNTGSDGQALLELPPDLLGALFQPGAANTIRRVDATFELLRYDPAALDGSEVAFGLGAENADGQRTLTEVRYTDSGLVSMGLNQNGRFRSATEFPRRDTTFQLSVRRTSPTTLGFFVNDRWLGDSVFLYPTGEPLTVVLSAAGQGVEVRISQWTIDYSPRDEIP